MTAVNEVNIVEKRLLLNWPFMVFNKVFKKKRKTCKIAHTWIYIYIYSKIKDI